MFSSALTAVVRILGSSAVWLEEGSCEVEGVSFPPQPASAPQSNAPHRARESSLFFMGFFLSFTVLCQHGQSARGGIDVKTVEPEVLLKNYAIVFQNVTLFDESVMENIRLGRSGASDEDVRAAAKAAQCDEFIDRLPQGYDTNIGENGSKLSGGERQRISIARALLKNAPVILLDEATASMDAESETMVQTALSALLKGRTVIVIAHRMRTIANADKIVVLDKGKVTEVGTPSELAKKGGLYAHLVALQQKQQMSSLPT